MKRKIGWTMALLLGLATAAGWAQDNAKTKEKEKNKPAAAAVNDPKEPVSVAGPSYIIGGDDILYISVWKESDLTTTLPVRPDGMVSLPLLNDVRAAGLTPMQLAASIQEKLKKYVTDPRVTVVVTAMNSQRIYVTGEVLHTGAMPLLPNMTVLQALANAGFSQFASTKGIYLLRFENGKQQKIPVNYRQLIKGEAMERNIILKPGDTIVVP